METYALSPMQRAMLSATLFDQRNGTYIQQMILKTREDLDEEAFREAWARLVRRHAILRTAFLWRNADAPLQHVDPTATMPWLELDWRGFDTEERESRFDTYLAEDRLSGFDMETAPLHRLSLIRIAENERWAVWTSHHALLDGRARHIVLKELFLFYEALCKGQDLLLPTPTPYRNYVDWLASRNFSESEPYWRNLLSGFTEPNRILSARPTPRPLSPAHTIGLAEAWVPIPLYADLRALAEKLNVTLNTLVQAAWGVLVSHHSGLDDVVFGATRSCRKSVPDGNSMVGVIINTTPVRVKIDPERRVADFIRELRQQHLAIRDHEHTPMARVHEWSDVPPGAPLFTTIVMFENYDVVKAEGGDWDKRRFDVKAQTDHLVLAGYLDHSLLLKIEYDRHLFDDDAVERMLKQVLSILESFARSPDGKLGEIPSLPDAEKHRVLREWNETKTDYPAISLGELFRAQAERSPNAIAVACGNDHLSYGELERRSNQLARFLKTRGIGPGHVVALLLDRSCDLAVALLGILKSGGAYLPLDPAYPAERLAYMLEDAQAKMLLSRAKLADVLAAPAAELLRLDADWERLIAGQSVAPIIPSEAGPDDTAYLMYTSGSTGLPKGVMVAHRGIVNLCAAMRRRYGLRPSDRVLQYASISFDICVEEIYPTWHAGATVVFRDASQGHSIHEFLDWAVRERISVFDIPTAFWNEWVQSLSATGAALPDALRTLVVGGEKASGATLATWLGLPGAERVAWFNTYGPTEATVTATAYQLPQTLPPGDPPIGRPIDNVRLYVLDSRLQPVPIGVPGELFIGGIGVAKGYLGRPELTAQAFLPDPFAEDSASRMYRTGDLVRYSADGMLSFVGRNDNQIKISGFRVEPGEIEAAIERHASVARAAVKAVGASGGKYLVAYIVPTLAEDPDLGKLEAFLRETLPDHEVPRLFVPMENFPLTPGGKIDRKALPDPKALDAGGSHAEGPRNEAERKLTEIFEELFPGRRIGIKDNFFALGGDSLRAFQLLTRIELSCGKRLSFAALARASSVEQLASLVLTGEAGETRHAHIVPLSTVALDGPRLFLVHGVGGSVHWYYSLADSLQSDFNVYGIQSPGLDDGDEARIGADVESLAQLYIAEIKNIQPAGPYYIGGHSMGGIIAFEISRQLHMEGSEIALVANFDNWNRAADAPSLSVKLWRLAIYFLKLDFAGKRQFLKDKFLWIRQCFAQCLAQRRASASVRSLDEIKTANIRAARRYVPGYFPGVLTVFRARRQNATALSDPLLGWHGLASEIDLIDVPGDHYSMLAEPNVQILASALRHRAKIKPDLH